jgi:hypothetical protein
VHPIIFILFLIVEGDNIQAAWTPPATMTLGQNTFCAIGRMVYFFSYFYNIIIPYDFILKSYLFQ